MKEISIPPKPPLFKLTNTINKGYTYLKNGTWVGAVSHVISIVNDWILKLENFSISQSKVDLDNRRLSSFFNSSVDFEKIRTTDRFQFHTGRFNVGILENTGVSRFCDASGSFTNLINKNCLEFMSGQYEIGSLDNQKDLVLLDNPWLMTNSPTKKPHALVISKYQNTGTVHSHTDLTYDLPAQPNKMKGNNIFFASRNPVKFEDLKDLAVADTLKVALFDLAIPEKIKLPNINHLYLIVANDMHIAKGLIVPQLTALVGKTFSLGTSNAQLGKLKTKRKMLTLSAETADLRFAQAFSQGDAIITARTKVTLGAAASAPADWEKHLGVAYELEIAKQIPGKLQGWYPQHDYVKYAHYADLNWDNPKLRNYHCVGLASTTISKPNGAYVSSKGKLKIIAPEIDLSFGESWSDVKTTFQAQKLIHMHTGSVRGAGDFECEAPQIKFIRVFPNSIKVSPTAIAGGLSARVSKKDVRYFMFTPHYNGQIGDAMRKYAPSDSSYVAFLGNIHLNTPDLEVFGSHVWAGGTLFHNGQRVIDPVTLKETWNGSTNIQPMSIGPGMDFPSTFLSGKILSITSPVQNLGCIANAPNVVVKGRTGEIMKPGQVVQNRTTTINLYKVACSLAQPGGLIEKNASGALTMAGQVGQPPSLNKILFMNPRPKGPVFNPMSAGIPLDFWALQALATHTYKVHVDGRSGKELIPYFQENAEQLMAQKGDQGVTKEDLKKNNKPLLFYKAKQVEDGVLAIPKLFIPPHERNEIAGVSGNDINIEEEEKLKVTGHVHSKKKSKIKAPQIEVIGEVKRIGSGHYERSAGALTSEGIEEVHYDDYKGTFDLVESAALWLNGAKSHTTSGATIGHGILVVDTPNVDVTQEQHRFTTLITKTVQTKKRHKKRTHVEHFLKEVVENIPTHISGLMMGNTITNRFDPEISALFPDRPAEGTPRGEILSTRGGLFKAGPGGIGLTFAKEHISKANIDTTYVPYQIGMKRYSESGSIAHHSAQPTQWNSDGPIQIWSAKHSLEATQFISRSPEGIKITARDHLEFPDLKVRVDHAPYLIPGKRGAVHKITGGHVEHIPAYFQSPGDLSVECLGGPVTGIRPTLDAFDPRVTSQITSLPSPVVEYYQQDECVLKGTSRSRSKAAMFASVALGVGLNFFLPGAGTIAGVALQGAGTAAASQFAGSVVSNKGHFAHALEDMRSKQAMRSIIAAAATANFGGQATSIYSWEQFVTSLPEYLEKGIGTGLLSAAIQKQSLKEGIVTGATFGFASAVGNWGASNLGKAYNYGQGNIGYLEHKFGHMALGGVLGAIISKDRLKGALIGGASAGVAEVIAEGLTGDVQAHVIGLKEAGYTDEQATKQIMNQARFNGEFSKLAAAGIAAAADEDVTTALFTASNAIENNYLGAALSYAIAGGLAAYTAYDIYDTYQAKGAEAALNKAGIEAATVVIGGAVIKTGFKVAGILYPTAEAAWAAHVATNPYMMRVVESTSPAFSKGKQVLGMITSKAAALNAAGRESTIGRGLAKFDATCEQWVQSGSSKVAGWFSKQGVQSEAYSLSGLDLAIDESKPIARFWNKSGEFTYKGQTNKVYQRDDLIDLNRIDPRTGLTSGQRMAQGWAPVGPDFKPINLHHMLQTHDGPIAELTQTFHQTYSKIIHINTSDIPSGIIRNNFDPWREAYWIKRLQDLGN